jgi:polyisoprenoid-binding protein YceI
LTTGSDSQAGGLVTYTIDPAHSCVSFSIRHMMVTTIRGRFDRVAGTVRFGADDHALGSVEATIDVASLHTGDATRDTHVLASPDFFDASAHPRITFTSLRCVPRAEGAAVLEGHLTMRGVARPVRLDVEYGGANRHVVTNDYVVGFSARGELDRRDWNLTWNAPLELGGLALSDTVRVEIDIQAIRAD